MERRVLGQLYRLEPLGMEQLIDRTEGHPFLVEECCMRLFRDGLVTTDSPGVYRLTAEGHRRYRDVE
ncbi:hypothetical protein [Halostella litorea]|uniref:hypothetical protein n=1 Tax=Halostella litorea TaxID=2528831 RepID=UPI0010930956|nr:hypothetical protein [Halostella litorea]